MKTGRCVFLVVCFFTCFLSTFSKLQNNHKKLDHIISKIIQSSHHLSERDHGNETQPPQPKLWALLVAGSNGYYNYRHQADVCHAYQVLIDHGFPKENIITMMYDDIANSTENPTPGVIINEPNGKDVYKGVSKDYVGKDVTPEVFLHVLSGNAHGVQGIGSGRVINSGPNDHIFVNFVDHGAPGLLAFPSSELHARQFQDTLLDMYHNHRYSKMVLYIEACESGSMFEDLLPENLNIFATTAANPHEHSYACYYDPKRNTYLGDVYSVMWMQDSDIENLSKETLFRQFSIVRKETNTSHVQEYGDLTIGKLKVAEFQGYGKKSGSGNGESKRVSPLLDAVPSGDVPLAILHQKLKYTASNEAQNNILRQIRHLEKKRNHLKNVIETIVLKATNNDKVMSNSLMSERKKLTNFDCYEELVHSFSQKCFNLSQNEYAYRLLYVLANLCQSSVQQQAVLRAMDTVCHSKRRYIGII